MLLDEIIDSVAEDEGIPIGNYLSQYSANYYLSKFDHWLKEEKHVRFYYRYMDDIVVLSNDKSYLRQLRIEIADWLNQNLKLELKSNWQVFPIAARGLDFVGYRIFPDYILLRDSTRDSIRIKSNKLKKKLENGGEITYSDWCMINSYEGWLKYCNGYNLWKKYLEPFKPLCDKYYNEKIKKRGGNNNDNLQSSSQCCKTC